MNRKIRLITPAISAIMAIAISGCQKYLDKKPDKQLVVPSTVADLQALLDNSNYMNLYSWGLGEASADDYYLTQQDWSSLYDEASKNVYIWGDEVVGPYPNNWSQIYQSIYYTNVVLDNINKVALNGSSEQDRNNAKGSALFFRSFAFFKVATTFAGSYDDKTADSDLGIPLRLSSDFNEKSVRGTLRQTYNQITADLLKSIPLLSEYPDHVLRPSKGAAYGMLARVYLCMRQYDKALLYADSSLQLNNNLLDFKVLSSAANYPISMFNGETVFYASGGNGNLINSMAKIDSNLYKSYDDNDLRKTIYFKTNGDGSHAFYGGYTGSLLLFLGIAVDEQYLIKAECLARSNKVQEAIDMLNELLVTRWKSGTFIPCQAGNTADALSTIFQERRKELLMRDLRWQDIKRLNKEGAGIDLKRVFDSDVYQLPPNSPKFALPLPGYIIETTGMEQNPR